MRKYLTLLGVVGLLFFGLGYGGKVEAVGTAPNYCKVSGASQSMTIPKGSFVWGSKVSGYPETNVLLFFPNGGLVTVQYGCVETKPNTSFLNRKKYLDSTYKTSFTCYVGNVKNPSCSGVVATATPSKTVVGTKTPTKVITKTPTRVVTASPVKTATPILTLRSDLTLLGAKKHLPKIGEVIWCKKFAGEVNTIRKIRVNYFYQVDVTDCGVQQKAPFNSLSHIKDFLEKTTKETWKLK